MNADKKYYILLHPLQIYRACQTTSIDMDETTLSVKRNLSLLQNDTH